MRQSREHDSFPTMTVYPKRPDSESNRLQCCCSFISLHEWVKQTGSPCGKQEEKVIRMHRSLFKNANKTQKLEDEERCKSMQVTLKLQQKWPVIDDPSQKERGHHPEL